MKKRIISLLMILVLCFSLLPFAALADAEEMTEEPSEKYSDEPSEDCVEGEDNPSDMPEEAEEKTEEIVEVIEEEGFFARALNAVASLFSDDEIENADTELSLDGATVTYDVSAALAYAKEYWNKNSGQLCAEFVSRCVKAGGLNISIETGTGGCRRAICNASGLSAQDLTLNSSGYATKSLDGDILAAGDVVFVWCYSDDIAPHVVLCGGYDSSGYAIYYAHNTAHGGDRLSFKNGSLYPPHSSSCKMGAKVIHLSQLPSGTTTYTVSYSANGGSGAPSSQTKTSNVSLTLTGTVPTRSGYVFRQWNTKSDGSGTGYAPKGSYTANSAATLYAIWEPIVNVGSDFYAFLTHYSGHHVVANGSNLELATTDRDDISQLWHFVQQDDGAYEISSVDTGLCIDVTSAGSTDSTNVGVYTDNDSNAQRWYLFEQTVNGGVYYALVPQCAPGRAMDVKGGSPYSPGTTIQIYRANGSGAQSYLLEETYFVEYDAAGGTGAPAKQVGIYGGELRISSTVPTREGCVFRGWADIHSIVEDVATYDSGDLYGMMLGEIVDIDPIFQPGDVFPYACNDRMIAVWKRENSGTESEDMTWEIDENGVLTISGTGAMPNDVPWQSRRNEITAVVIETGMTSIGDGAFEFCEKLTSVSIPDSVISIGENAFWFCDKLEAVTLPSKVESIGEYAFFSCPRLTSMTIPNGVKCIEDYTFCCCTGLTSVLIPSSVTSIGAWAFESCLKLENVTIPGNVESIGEYAFYDCDELESVTIPGGVTSIGNNAFSGCPALTSISVSSSNQNYCDLDGILFNKEKSELILCPDGRTGDYAIPDSVTTIGNNAFWNCAGLTSVTIPSGVTDIGERAFDRCTGLEEVVLPDNVTSIEERTFSNCTGLTSVTIPDSMLRIEEWAFDGCTNLTDVFYPGSRADWHSIEIGDWNTYLTNATIHYGIGTSGACGDNATWVLDDDGVLTISGEGDMPDMLESAPWAACRNDITSVVIESGITSIGVWAFSNCENLTSVSIPSSVTRIESGAFQWCTSLSSITIPDTVTSMGECVFFSCDALNDVTLSSGLTSISRCMFQGCSSLTEFVIPEGVTSIGDWTLSFCSELASVTIPISMELIDDSAFSCCEALTDVYYAGSKDEWNAITIVDWNEELLGATIHCADTPLEPGGEIEFSSFAELKELCAKSYDGSVEFRYTGDGSLVISEDLILPEDSTLNCETLVINSGVELVADWIFTQSLSVNGTLFAGQPIYVFADDPDAVVGAENIRFAQSYFNVILEDTVETLDELYAWLSQANTLSEHVKVIIEVAEKDVVLDSDMTVSDKFQLSLRDSTLTVPTGGKLSNAGFIGVYGDSEIVNNGAFENNGCVSLNNPGTFEQGKDASYSGYGSFQIENYGNDYEQALEGLDLTKFSVEQSSYWVGEDEYTNYVLRYIGDLIQLDPPTDLAWRGAAIALWTMPTPNTELARLTLYKSENDDEKSDGWIYLTEVYTPTNDCRYDFSETVSEYGEGEYYFTVTALGDSYMMPGGQYADSETVTSESWHYYAPSRQFSSCTDLSLSDDLTATWTWPDRDGWSYPQNPEDYADLFHVQWFYSPTESGTPQDTGWAVWPTINYEESDELKSVLSNFGTGYYSFRVKVVSNDISRVQNSPWSELSPALYVDRSCVGRIDYWIGDDWPWGTDTQLIGKDVTIYPYLLDDCPVRDGYYFLGWSSEEDADEAEYWPGDTLTLTGDLNLYAVWGKSVSGSCGENLTWALDDNGVLMISGTGAMTWEAGKDAPWRPHRYNIKSIVIESGVTSIVSGAFCDSINLESISIPDSIVEIGESAFWGCYKLADEDGFVIIRDILYGYYGEGGDVVVPNGVKTIGYDAFMQKELTSITLPDSVTEIGEAAFAMNPGMADENGFVIVRDMLCGYYGEAENVVIPDGIKTIGFMAFPWKSSEKSLMGRSIAIPHSVIRIGENAFYACDSLQYIYYDGSMADWQKIDIDEYQWDSREVNSSRFQTATILYSEKSKNDSASGVCGKNYKLRWILDCEGCMTFSGAGVLDDNLAAVSPTWEIVHNQITSVVIGDQITEIGDLELGGLRNLKTVSFGNNIKSIGDYAFNGSDSLADVYFNGTQKEWTALLENVGSNNENLLNATIHFAGECINTFAGLQAAINAAPTDGAETTVTLTGNLDGKGEKANSITISDGRNIKLDLAGYTMDLGMDEIEASVFTVDGATLTIQDNSRDESGIITGGTNGGVRVFSGSLVLNSGTICGNTAEDCGGGIYIADECAFEMNGGTICDNEALSGAGVYLCHDADFVMNGGAISDNTALSAGGGVNAKSRFIMNGGVIQSNTAAQGGGVFVWGTFGHFQLKYGKVNRNTAEFGGGVYVNAGNFFTMTGGELCGNEATGYTDRDGIVSGGGGAVCGLACNVELIGGTVSGNTGYIGGATYCTDSVHPMTGATQKSIIKVGGSVRITDNTDGAGKTSNVYLLDGQTLMLSETVFTDSAMVGVTTENVPTAENAVTVISSGATSAMLSCFSPDNESYGVSCVENALVLCVQKSLDIEIDEPPAAVGATITAPEGGWVEGENTFTVACEKACVLLVTDDGGKTYTRLKATAGDGEYSFTANLTADSQIVCAVKGDLSGDGRIRANEAKAVLKASAGGSVTALQKQIADVNGDGRIRANEAKAILKASAGGSLSW